MGQPIWVKLGFKVEDGKELPALFWYLTYGYRFWRYPGRSDPTPSQAVVDTQGTGGCWVRSTEPNVGSFQTGFFGLNGLPVTTPIKPHPGIFDRRQKVGA